MCFQGFWVTDLSGKICTLIFVVNNKYCFKRFLSCIYLVNFDMDLVNSINTKPLRLTIISDLRKYGFRERARFKILWFDDQPNPTQTQVWKGCQTQNTPIQGLWCFMVVSNPR
jgi:hypothetical protein